MMLYRSIVAMKKHAVDCGCTLPASGLVLVLLLSGMDLRSAFVGILMPICSLGMARGRPKVMLRVLSSKTTANHVRFRTSFCKTVYSGGWSAKCSPRWTAPRVARP